ncbi:MAG TPA: helix-turn-helix transcriptional regulator, partial [Chloroflexia bacterium]|nr:helix-turn-helix transcriptional regulator [Chloroflexia bacterium]
MEPVSLQDTVQTLSARIRKARLEQGLTQEQLAGPEFTKGYVSALERGTVRPSLKALDVFSKRLGMTLSYFVGAPQEDGVDTDLAAIEEDLHYQITYAKMLIRTNRVDEAFDVIAEAERSIEPYSDKLDGEVRYLPPFVRARAYLQRSQPNLARPELEAALKLVRSDVEGAARVRNL